MKKALFAFLALALLTSLGVAIADPLPPGNSCIIGRNCTLAQLNVFSNKSTAIHLTTDGGCITFSDGTTQCTAGGGGGGVTGSGVAGRSTFWSGASSISSDVLYQWDNIRKVLDVGSPSGADIDQFSNGKAGFFQNNNTTDSGFTVLIGLYLDAGTPGGFGNFNGALYVTATDFIGDAGNPNAQPGLNAGYFTTYATPPSTAWTWNMNPLTGYAEVITGGLAGAAAGVSGFFDMESSGTAAKGIGTQGESTCTVGTCLDIRGGDFLAGATGGTVTNNFGVRYKRLGTSTHDYGFNIQEGWTGGFPFYFDALYYIDANGNEVTPGFSSDGGTLLITGTPINTSASAAPSAIAIPNGSKLCLNNTYPCTTAVESDGGMV